MIKNNSVQEPHKTFENGLDLKRNANRLAQRKHREKREKERQRLLREIKEFKTVLQQVKLAADAKDMVLVRAQLSSLDLSPTTTSGMRGHRSRVTLSYHAGIDSSLPVQPPERSIRDATTNKDHHSVQLAKPLESTIVTADEPTCLPPLNEKSFPQSQKVDPVNELAKLDQALCEILERMEIIDSQVEQGHRRSNCHGEQGSPANCFEKTSADISFSHLQN